MTDKERLEKLLASMGDTPEAVPEWLYRRGFRGSKQISYCCPVAHAIKWNFPGHEPRVDLGSCSLYGVGSVFGFGVNTTDAVTRFVSNSTHPCTHN